MEKELENTVNFRKNFIWNMIGVSLNSFNSLFYMVIITRVNGTDAAGIFTLGFSIACLVYYIGTYAGRVYQVTDTNKDITDTDYIIQRVICFCFLLLVSVGYSVFRGYTIEKFIIVFLLCLMKGLESFSDVLYGILQKNDHLYYAGYSLTIKSMVSIVLFILLDIITRNLLLSVSGMVLVWIITTLLFDIPKALKYVKSTFEFRFNRIINLFKNGFFIFIVNFLAIYIVNAPKYAADGLLSDSSQAIFGIILMPATLLSVAVQYFIQPYLVRLSKFSQEKDFISFNKIVRKLIGFSIVIGIICLIVVHFIGIPVLSVIYGVDLASYKFDLELIIVASVLNPINIILSTVLITVNMNFVQFIFYGITSLISLFICPILISELGVFGATISYFIIMLCQSMLFTIYYVYINITKKLFYRVESLDPYVT